MIEKVLKKKRTKVHKWMYEGRTLTIEQYTHAPKTIHFVGGIYISVDNAVYSLTAVSRFQKQLRQQLYGWLLNNGLNTSNYILNIDAPERIGGNKVFLELVIMFQPSDEIDVTKICEHFFLQISPKMFE